MVHNIYYQEERNSKNKMFRVSIGIECNHEHLNTIQMSSIQCYLSSDI